MTATRDSGAEAQVVFSSGEFGLEKTIVYGQIDMNVASGMLVLAPHKVEFHKLSQMEFDAILILFPSSAEDRWILDIKQEGLAGNNRVNRMLRASDYQLPLTIAHTGQSFGQIKDEILRVLEAIQAGVDQLYDKMLRQSEQKRKELESDGGRMLPDVAPGFWHATHRLNLVEERIRGFTVLDGYTP